MAVQRTPSAADTACHPTPLSSSLELHLPVARLRHSLHTTSTTTLIARPTAGESQVTAYPITMSAEASSSSGKPPSASAPTADVADIEKLLSREATAFQREMEVERILKAFKLK